MSQHKSSLRRSLRAAICNKSAADSLIDSLALMQTKLNATLNKLNVDSAAAVAATATLDLTNDIVLTSVAAGAARNTTTFTLQILAADANPTDTILADFTGTSAAIVLTITPNDGTFNSLTPVDLTTAEVRELINSGSVVGKSVTVTDGSSLRALQTATGGGAQDVADGGEGDGVVGTFAGGVATNNLDTNYAATQAIASPFAADVILAERYKVTVRKVIRSGITHKKAADSMVDALATLEAKFNLLLIKLDAEGGTLNDTNYVSTLGVSAIIADAAIFGEQDKASFRKIMRAAMAHKKLADSIVDGICGAQASFNSALAKLDASSVNGQLGSLVVSVINPDSY